jgi:hypothetical protein
MSAENPEKMLIRLWAPMALFLLHALSANLGNFFRVAGNRAGWKTGQGARCQVRFAFP